jgi:hypothetical protein
MSTPSCGIISPHGFSGLSGVTGVSGVSGLSGPQFSQLSTSNPGILALDLAFKNSAPDTDPGRARLFGATLAANALLTHKAEITAKLVRNLIFTSYILVPIVSS